MSFLCDKECSPHSQATGLRLSADSPGLGPPIDMRFFRRPVGFVSALRCHAARLLGVPAEQLNLSAQCRPAGISSREASGQFCVTVTGLLIEGCRIDEQTGKKKFVVRPPCAVDVPFRQGKQGFRAYKL